MAQFALMSIGERAWYAWRCLPRDELGEAPKKRFLERQHGLSNKSLARWIEGEVKRPTMEQTPKVARALGTTPEWLVRGVGEPPRPHGHAPEPYPERLKKRAESAESGTYPAAEVTPAAKREHAGSAAAGSSMSATVEEAVRGEAKKRIESKPAPSSGHARK